MVSAFTKKYAGTICDAMADSHRPTSDAMSCFHGGYIMEIVSAYYCFYEPGFVYGYRLDVDGHDGRRRCAPPTVQRSRSISLSARRTPAAPTCSISVSAHYTTKAR